MAVAVAISMVVPQEISSRLDATALVTPHETASLGIGVMRTRIVVTRERGVHVIKVKADRLENERIRGYADIASPVERKKVFCH